MKNPSRKYIDLILAASSKWANWDPPNQIKVGDYGKISKETGQFEKEGNIYDDPSTASLAAQNLPEIGTPENSFAISSSGVTCLEFVLGPSVGVAGLAEASIRGRWEFGNRRGALLIMARPQSSYVPPRVFLKQLIKIPVLQDKSLVTQVVSCPAYSLYLSSANKSIIDISLLGSIPVPLAPIVSAGGEIGAAWRTSSATGLFRDACEATGSYKFTPLYTLQKIRRKGILRRESPVPDPEDDDLWVNAQEPWDPLDDNGEEEEFEDTVFD